MDERFRSGQGKERVDHVPAVVTRLLKFTPKVKWITLSWKDIDNYRNRWNQFT